jgi:hypothetical protein
MGPNVARPTEPTPAPSEPPSTERASWRKDSQVVERRIPSARETLATLPDIDEDLVGFEPHDTIPAPPWAEEESAPTQRSSERP